MKTKLYNQTGTAVGEVELPDRIFAQPMNRDLVYQVARAMRANQRKPYAHTKGRGEVRGGGRKPWAQKGTGRARHGSSRSPIWKGGGVTHGPRKEKNFKKALNQKMRQKAVAAVLSEKIRRDEVRVLESLGFSQPKTKEAVQFLDRFLKDGTRRHTALVVIPEKNENVVRAVRNLPYAKAVRVPNVNTLDLLERRIVIFPKDAVSIFEKSLKHA